jgi:rubredoxin
METIVFEKWVCTCCGYVYDPAVGDPERGIPPGTTFENLPVGWTCPLCYAIKKAFEPV